LKNPAIGEAEVQEKGSQKLGGRAKRSPPSDDWAEKEEKRTNKKYQRHQKPGRPFKTQSKGKVQDKTYRQPAEKRKTSEKKELENSGEKLVEDLSGRRGLKESSAPAQAPNAFSGTKGGRVKGVRVL